MDSLLLWIVAASIIFGIVSGIFIVLSIRIGRKNSTIDSLLHPSDIVGLLGTVEVPFDANSKGKVRINVGGSTVDFIALTDCNRYLNKGDRVIVLEIKDNRIWVIPEELVMLPSND